MKKMFLVPWCYCLISTTPISGQNNFLCVLSCLRNIYSIFPRMFINWRYGCNTRWLYNHRNAYLCARHFLLHYKELATINIYLLKLAFKCKGVILSKKCFSFFFAGNRILFLFSGSYPKPIGPSCLSLSGFRMYLAYLNNNIYFSFAQKHI